MKIGDLVRIQGSWKEFRCIVYNVHYKSFAATIKLIKPENLLTVVGFENVSENDWVIVLFENERLIVPQTVLELVDEANHHH